MIPIITQDTNTTKGFLLAHIPYLRYAFYRLSLDIIGKPKLRATVCKRVHAKFYVLHIVNVQAHAFTNMHV